jgi:tetratricopeptide (TPR) repeat protein
MEWAVLAGDSAGVEAAAAELIADYGTFEVAAEAWLALAGISEEGGNYPLALARLQSLVGAFPSSRQAPLALMEEGRLLETRLGRPQEALMRYESILTDYPQSVYAGDARRRVESLRRELKS